MFGTAKYQSVGGSLKTIYTEDGIRGFYKGNGANIARCDYFPIFLLSYFASFL